MNMVYLFLRELVDPLVIALAVLAACFIMMWPFKGYRRVIAVKILLGVVIAALYLLGITPVKNILVYPLEKNYFGRPLHKPQYLDVVIALSAGSARVPGTDQTVLGDETQARLLQAVQIFKRSGADYLVCSGAGRTSIAAGAMAMTARRLGIPLTSIVVDDKARNTAEHAIELDNRFKDKTIKVGVVTTAYHLKRSCRQFEKYFENVHGYPSGFLYTADLDFRSFMPGTNDLSRSAAAIRELTANLWYRLRYGSRGVK